MRAKFEHIGDKVKCVRCEAEDMPRSTGSGRPMLPVGWIYAPKYGYFCPSCTKLWKELKLEIAEKEKVFFGRDRDVV